jgi:hypothetical protein
MLRNEFKGKSLVKIDVRDEDHLKLEGVETGEPAPAAAGKKEEEVKTDSQSP